ncbi:YHYH domain-containing protein [Rhodoferax sp.]|nr:YHYH domain-containing protein [Rhodoferax sp.]MDZ7918493.1 YHYH domain-containing protein [Rhodoferax sp.]
MKRLIILATLLASGLAFAHSGGTDSNGCHTNHKTGERHCH